MATRGIAVRPLGDNLVEVTVQAGEPLGSLVAYTVTESLSGIEYLGGIPGTTGAAPVQNTGAYGQQISDTLTRLTVHDWALGRTRKLRPDQCRFGYRTSTFKTQPGQFTILDVRLRLTRRTPTK
jgi:UDP-N-acetylmuramate dehydrogenase